MNSTEGALGKIKTRTEAAPATVVSQPTGTTAERPRILELLLRIPVGDADPWDATEGCGCGPGRACPFRALCAD